MPSLRPLASISYRITSIHVFFGLPCALLTCPKLIRSTRRTGASVGLRRVKEAAKGHFDREICRDLNWKGENSGPLENNIIIPFSYNLHAVIIAIFKHTRGVPCHEEIMLCA